MRLGILLRSAVILVAIVAGVGSLAAQQAVVVELFTSEGCSSCPPADALLSQLSKQRNAVRGIDLILLEEHVEYWNGQGWRDRFSAPAYTQRQYDYVHQLRLETPYTPQVVVDGHGQASGGNAGALNRLIAESSQASKSAKVTLEPIAPDKWKVTVADPGDRELKVLLAVTEDNLETKVGGGENGGRTLTHDAVVRELQPIGTVTSGRFERVVSPQAKTEWKQDDLRVVVLVQDADSGAIHGAAAMRWNGAPAQSAGR
jgi:hypothetical protein